MKTNYIEEVSVFKLKNHEDERGSFYNLISTPTKELNKIWKSRTIAQVNLSFNPKKATLRGFHFQKGIFSDAKIIRCIEGSVFDVVVDLRRTSKTFGFWFGVTLSNKSNNTIFIPEGCAHGFQTLEDNVLLSYVHSREWSKDNEGGVRWNDPHLKVEWPLEPINVSTRDQQFKNLIQQNEF